MLRRVEIFYDVVSPYSYLGFVTLLRYEKVHNVEIKLRPFFLGGASLFFCWRSAASIFLNRLPLLKIVAS